MFEVFAEHYRAFLFVAVVFYFLGVWFGVKATIDDAYENAMEDLIEEAKSWAVKKGYNE